MNQANPKNLELGRSLRGSATLIPCRAIVEYSDRSNWQPYKAVIPPGGINSEGYVEEVWIDARLQEREVDGEKHLIINPSPVPIISLGECWIDRFELSPSETTLRPSSELEVKFWITP